jgi:N6-L-threonylcarbamoyladenine synthase
VKGGDEAVGSLILGIESSCDESAVSIVRDGVTVLADRVASQSDLHQRYGGVVPEVASRRHIEAFPRLIEEALRQAGVGYTDLKGVAVTAAPGLIGALLVGLSFAKGLAFRLGLPLTVVHHVEAHLYACCLNASEVAFPALGLAVSGGHTEIHRIEEWGRYETVCSTRDDAAGEAFDKAAKLLGLGYPGGPLIEKLALQAGREGGAYPLVKIKDKSLDFSFSGLKTAVSLEVRKNPGMNQDAQARLAAKFQRSVVAEITSRIEPLLVSLSPRSLVVGGGVACNNALRESLQTICDAQGVILRIPPPAFCGDNAAMIAGLGARQIEAGRLAPWSSNAVASPSSDVPFLIR